MEINLKSGLLVVAVACGFSSLAVAQDRHRQVSESRYWRRLLHYPDGPGSSEIDRREFFLSPIGHFDPHAELETSIVAFGKPADARTGAYDQHPQCAYPERFRFLRSELGLSIAAVECPEFTKWRTGISAEGVSLVYAAPYLGNPASMFGHTFLRFRSVSHDASDPTSLAELSDATVSFDALPTEDKGLTYAYKGVSGGYRGVFSIQPYYSKIHAYSDIEGRTLWDYRLRLSSEQIDRLIAHLWELGAAEFDYYFIDQNCSYQLQSLLEIANPEWSLRPQFRYGTIPLDTVRAVLSQKDSVSSVSQRASRYTKLSARLERLRSEEKRQFDRIIRKPSMLDGTASASVLDALIDWNDYQRENKIDGGHPFAAPVEFEILKLRSKSARSQTAEEKDPTQLISKSGPEIAHSTSKLSVTFARGLYGEAYGLSLRPVLHDLLERDFGYVAHSSLVVGQTSFQYQPNSGRFALERFTVAEVVNFQPISALRKNASWEAHLSVGRPDNDSGFDDFGVNAMVGFGGSVASASEKLLLAGVLKLRSELSNTFQHRYGSVNRNAISVEARSILAAGDFLKAEFVAESGFRFPRFQFANRVHAFTDLRLSIAQALKLNGKREYEVRLEAEGLDVFRDIRWISKVSIAAFF